MAPMGNNRAVKVEKITEAQGVDEQNRPKKEIVVSFRVGEHGPFTERFVRDGFNAVAVAERINAFARELNALPQA